MKSVPMIIKTDNGKCTNDDKKWLMMVSVPRMVKNYNGKCTNNDNDSQR